MIGSEPRAALDYAEIVDADTFEPAAGLNKTCYAAIAARVGSTRLIDNALVEPIMGPIIGRISGADGAPSREQTSGELRVTL